MVSKENPENMPLQQGSNKTFEERIEEIRGKIRWNRQNGQNPLNAFTDQKDEKLLDHFVTKEKIGLFDDFNKGKPFFEKLKDRLCSFLGIKNKQNINYTDKDGKLPLDYLTGSEGMAKIAVEQFSADINKANARGETALMNAAEKGQDQSFAYLINKGANYQAVDLQGQNLLHKLTKNFDFIKKDGQLKIIEMLKPNQLEQLIDQSDKIVDKVTGKIAARTPIMYAVDNNNRGAFEMLQKMYQIAPDIPLLEGVVKTTEALLGENPNRKNLGMDKLFIASADLGNVPLFDYLLEKKANVLAVDESGQNLLHKIMQRQDFGHDDYKQIIDKLPPQVLNELLGQYDKGMSEDKKIRTPLHYLGQGPATDKDVFALVEHLAQKLPDNHELQNMLKVRDGVKIPDDFIDKLQRDGIGEQVARDSQRQESVNIPANKASQKPVIRDSLKDIDINKINQDGRLPGEYLLNSPEKLKDAVENMGLNPNKPNAFGETLVMIAAQKGYDKQFKYLVEGDNNSLPIKDFNIQAVDNQGQNLLHKMALNLSGMESYSKIIDIIHPPELQELISRNDKGNPPQTPLNFLEKGIKNLSGQESEKLDKAFNLLGELANRLPDNQELKNILKGEKSPNDHLKDLVKQGAVEKEYDKISQIADEMNVKSIVNNSMIRQVGNVAKKNDDVKLGAHREKNAQEPPHHHRIQNALREANHVRASIPVESHKVPEQPNKVQVGERKSHRKNSDAGGRGRH